MTRSITTVALCAAATVCAAVSGPVTGAWSAPPAALPNGQLPDVPLLGNGALGILFDAHSAGSSLGVGPGRNNTLDIWFGSSSFWSCRNCTTPAKGCCGAIALGGVSISMLPSFPSETLGFSATQVTSRGILESSWTSASAGTLSTVTYMHPELRVVVTELRWNATGALSNLVLNVSTWVLGPNPGAHAGPMPTFAGCVDTSGAPQPCASGAAAPGLLTAASRAASNTSINSGGPHPVWAALATAFLPTTAVSATAAVPGSSTNAPWASTAAVTIPSGGGPVIIVTAEAEVVGYSGADPTAAAAVLASEYATPGHPELVADAATAWWSDFWSRSSVSIGDADAPTTLPEAMWWGAQYILGCTASSDPSVPPPALYGVWVTSDNANWNGDYTLDYNSESTFFGAFASNHPAQAGSYAQPLIEWLPAGLSLAQSLAVQARVACPATAAVYACHLAPWGFQSDDQSRYMLWNLNFALLPLISQWEFTHNLTAAAAALPMLEGATDWWKCYLEKVPTPDNSSYVYHDTNKYLPDNEHENQDVADPQIGLSLIARCVAAHIDISLGLGLGAPPAAVDILTHLAPYNTGAIRYNPAANFSVTSNWRFSGDFHMGSAPDVAGCEAACAAAAGCSCFTFCPSPAVNGCPDGPSCWFYSGPTGGHAGPGFTAGCADNSSKPEELPVWTAYANALPTQSDTFAFYPTYPSESLGGLTVLPEAVRATAQTSSHRYTPDWVNSGRPLDVFVAATLALAGGGPAPLASPVAYSADDIWAGLTAYLGAYLGRNQLARAPGGGVENVGVSRAVTEMLLGSGVLVPTLGPAGDTSPCQWVTRLFPVWPANMSVAFTGLVAKGGIAASAAYSAETQAVAPQVYLSAPFAAAGSAVNATLRSPWPAAPQASVSVSCSGGGAPAVTWLSVSEGNTTVPALSFLIPPNATCEVALAG